MRGRLRFGRTEVLFQNVWTGIWRIRIILPKAELPRVGNVFAPLYTHAGIFNHYGRAVVFANSDIVGHMEVLHTSKDIGAYIASVDGLFGDLITIDFEDIRTSEVLRRVLAIALASLTPSMPVEVTLNSRMAFRYDFGRQVFTASMAAGMAAGAGAAGAASNDGGTRWGLLGWSYPGGYDEDGAGVPAVNDMGSSAGVLVVHDTGSSAGEAPRPLATVRELVPGRELGDSAWAEKGEEAGAAPDNSRKCVTCGSATENVTPTSPEYAAFLRTWWPRVVPVVQPDSCTGDVLSDGRIRFHKKCYERMAKRLQQPLTQSEQKAFNRIRCDAFRPGDAFRPKNPLYEHLKNLCSHDPATRMRARNLLWCQPCRSKVAANYLPRFFPKPSQGGATAAAPGARSRRAGSRLTPTRKRTKRVASKPRTRMRARTRTPTRRQYATVTKRKT